MLFASIETVSFFQFMVATLCYTPKLMFAVWVGSRIAMLSDGQQRGEMDTAAKIVNTLSIVLGVAIGVGTGWLALRPILKLKLTRLFAGLSTVLPKNRSARHLETLLK